MAACWDQLKLNVTIPPPPNTTATVYSGKIYPGDVREGGTP